MSVAGSATRVTTTAVAGRRHAAMRSGPAMCPQRRVRPDLLARRSGREGRAGSALRPGAGRPVSPAVYRRRRRLVGLTVAIAVTVLTLGAQAAFTDSGSGPAFGVVFTPWLLMPVGMACLVGLLRSGGGGRRPASPSPAAGSASVELSLARAA